MQKRSTRRAKRWIFGRTLRAAALYIFMSSLITPAKVPSLMQGRRGETLMVVPRWIASQSSTPSSRLTRSRSRKYTARPRKTGNALMSEASCSRESQPMITERFSGAPPRSSSQAQLVVIHSSSRTGSGAALRRAP